jgi:hyaluronan synthase
VIHLTLYAVVLATWLGLRLFFSRRNPPPPMAWWFGTRAGVIPTYNEDPAVLAACVASLRHQVDELWVVDDGSAVPAQVFPNTRHVRFDVNMGKRSALAHVIKRTTAEVIVTVDSDTVVEERAVRTLVSAFSDRRVHAATGLVRATNSQHNLLTRLIDLRYAAAFLGERAAYSAFGSVLCCCGSLAAYRVATVLPYMHDLTHQRLLGRRVAGGDDRRMTNYALLSGRAVLVEGAKATTLVPERLSHFLRQQTRWSRSFLRETLWALAHLRGRARALAAIELGVQVALTAGVVVGVLRLAGGLPLWTYLLWTGIAALARMSPAMRVSGKRPPLLLAPLYGLLHIILLMPLRVWAFATVRDGSWLTRDQIEVALPTVNELLALPTVDDLAKVKVA